RPIGVARFEIQCFEFSKRVFLRAGSLMASRRAQRQKRIAIQWPRAFVFRNFLDGLVQRGEIVGFYRRTASDHPESSGDIKQNDRGQAEPGVAPGVPQSGATAPLGAANELSGSLRIAERLGQFGWGAAALKSILKMCDKLGGDVQLFATPESRSAHDLLH